MDVVQPLNLIKTEKELINEALRHEKKELHKLNGEFEDARKKLRKATEDLGLKMVRDAEAERDLCRCEAHKKCNKKEKERRKGDLSIAQMKVNQIKKDTNWKPDDDDGRILEALPILHHKKEAADLAAKAALEKAKVAKQRVAHLEADLIAMNSSAQASSKNKHANYAESSKSCCQ